MTFEPLRVGNLALSRLPPACLHIRSIREVWPGIDYSPVSKFELTGTRGVVLVTKYPVYGRYSTSSDVFERYTRQHYESWVTFACSSGYGDDVQPILVAGFDMTGDFATVTYSHDKISRSRTSGDDLSRRRKFTPGLRDIRDPWRAHYSAHTNYGPQGRIPPEQAIDTPPLQLAEVETIPSAFNQCVSIHYYTMSGGPLGPHVRDESLD